MHIETGGGLHGYDDTSPDGSYDEEGPNPDMRGIFFANGPSFRSDGAILPWIKLVDEYQVVYMLLARCCDYRAAGMFSFLYRCF